jgi:hypothetical protein
MVMIKWNDIQLDTLPGLGILVLYWYLYDTRREAGVWLEITSTAR